MNTISIHRLEPELQAWLQAQATAHGVSMEEEVRRVLRAARAAAERQEPTRADREGLFQMAIKPGPGSCSSTEILRQMRDER